MSSLLLIKILCSFAAIILLMYFCFHIAKKKLLTRVTSHGRIRVIEYKKVDQKLSLSLLIIDGEKLVLASSPNAIAFARLSSSNEDAKAAKQEFGSSVEIH